MNQSDSIANLAKSMAAAQAEMTNPKFDSTNPHFKSKFASLAAVRECVIPVLAKHGIQVSQFPVSEGNAAGCVTIIAHESGEWMRDAFLIPCDKQNAHGYASAVTYARRISLQSIAGVVGEQDDDGNGAVASKLNDKAIAQFTHEMQSTTTREELTKVWQEAAEACQKAGDNEAYSILKKVAAEVSKTFKVEA
jgi:hypothetical protein